MLEAEIPPWRTSVQKEFASGKACQRNVNGEESKVSSTVKSRYAPNEGVDETSYTVAFYECDNEPDAWIALYLAITKKAKRQQVSEV